MDTNSLSVPRAGRKLLDPSELGTQEYWDAAYAHEIHNNDEDAEDVGMVWFDESNAETVVMDTLNDYAEDGQLDHSTSRVLDLGTGNGHMLAALRDDDGDEGRSWSGEMVGVDYSAASIRLARQLEAQRQTKHETSDGIFAAIRFEQWNILSESPGDWLREGFDVVLDKGTFDAISLMPYTDDAPHPCETYRVRTVPLIKPGKFLLVTSCNWTKEELVEWLAPEGGALVLIDEAKYPTFTFGGKTGQSVVTLVFRRS